MRKRRVKRMAGYTNPFKTSMDMFRVGVEMAELFTSSTQVIAYRSTMISQAMSGKLPFHDKEFMDMWQEKFIASGQSWTVAMRYFGKSKAGAVYLSKLMSPYRHKATANAKRLYNKR